MRTSFIFCIVFFILVLMTKSKVCYEIGRVYKYVLDSNIEMFSSRNLQNTSLPRINNSTHVEFSLKPIEVIGSDSLISTLEVGVLN